MRRAASAFLLVSLLHIAWAFVRPPACTQCPCIATSGATCSSNSTGGPFLYRTNSTLCSAGVGFGSLGGVAYCSAGDFALAVETSSGNLLRIESPFNNATASISLVAGCGATGTQTDGVGVAACFGTPVSVALSADCSTAYVSDAAPSGVIRRVAIATRNVTTFCGGGGSAAGADCGAVQFTRPTGLYVNSDAGVLFVVAQHALYRVTLASGAVALVAGGTASGPADGTGAAAQLDLTEDAYGLDMDPARAILYIPESPAAGVRIRAVEVATGAVTTLASAPSELAGATAARAVAYAMGRVYVAVEGGSPGHSLWSLDAALGGAPVRFVGTGAGAVAGVRGAALPLEPRGLLFSDPQGAFLAAGLAASGPARGALLYSVGPRAANLSRAGDQVTYRGRLSLTIVYKLTGASAGALDAMRLSFDSANKTLLPLSAAFVAGWSEAYRTVILSPPRVLVAQNVTTNSTGGNVTTTTVMVPLTGTSLVTVNVTDGCATYASDAFTVRVKDPVFGGVEVDSPRRPGQEIYSPTNATCTLNRTADSSVWIECLDTCTFDWPTSYPNNIGVGQRYDIRAWESNQMLYFPLCDPKEGASNLPPSTTPGRFLGCSFYTPPNVRACDPSVHTIALGPVGYSWTSAAGCVQVTPEECTIWMSCALPCCDSACQKNYCFPTTTCKGHGQCNADGSCTCDPYYYGTDCSRFCNATETCLGMGSCAPSTGLCVCRDGQTGASCETPPPPFAVSGTAFNALTGLALAGVAVTVRGPAPSTAAITWIAFPTQASGAYAISAIRYIPGRYILDASVAGFIGSDAAYFDVPWPVSQDYALRASPSAVVNIYLTPSIGLNQLRIVLSWSKWPPYDLDAHLALPYTTNYLYSGVTYQAQECYWLTSPCSAVAGPNGTDAITSTLDLDNTNRAEKTKPETMTITNHHDGRYQYWVHQYTGWCPRADGTCAAGYVEEVGTEMGSSGVRVDVFTGADGLVASFDRLSNVNATGFWWHVFDVNGTTFDVIPINTLVRRPVTPDGTCPNGYDGYFPCTS